MIETDYLVIGSGLAGLYFALRASEHGRVIVATKRAPADANTAYAQGGVAGVIDPDDRVEAHVEDTLSVGDGLCHRDIVELCAREAPEHILWFANELGVPFDRDADGQLELGREGGHTARRIVHAKDTTGWAIEAALLARVAARADRITVLPDHMAIDLLTTAKYGGPNAVFGAYVLEPDDRRGRGRRRARRRCWRPAAPARSTSTRPTPTSRPATASRWPTASGARVANMEFFQFHPTCLYHPQAKSFLITEALRGEGGILRLRDGTAFMERYHAMKELAPRDVVARAIDAELKRTGDDCVVLDMTHLPADFLRRALPQHPRALHAARHRHARRSRSRSCPPRTTAAAASSSTSTAARRVKNLYAIGEVSMTGLHGACRLASNSLLEAMVFAARAADDVRGVAERRARRRWRPGTRARPGHPTRPSSSATTGTRSAA